ncbi:MAG TPA: nitrate- and nitrite sensing domain-containing protein [Streptosporangiaceae bacterium]|nr:nitrate- and nitrite sensing domain-containing protein [Streptosporangiaceae bacterium]
MPSRSKKGRDGARTQADHNGAEVAADYGQSANGNSNGRGPAGGPVGGTPNGVPGNGPAILAADGPVAPPDAAQPDGAGEQPEARTTGRLLRNWRVRSRLVLLIAIPTATAVALGGTSIVSSWRSAVADQRTQVLASVSTKITDLAYQIESERDAIVWYIAAGPGGRAGYLAGHENPDNATSSKGRLQFAQQQFVFTGKWVRIVRTAIGQIGSGYPAAVRANARAVLSQLKTLASLRREGLTSRTDASTVISHYDGVVQTLLAFDDQVALSSADPQLASTARALGTISRDEDTDSVERAVIIYALVSGQLPNNLLGQLNSAQANQQADLNGFGNFATTSQKSLLSNAMAESLQDRVTSDIQDVLQHSDNVSQVPLVPAEWYGDMSDAISQVHSVEETVAGQAVARAQDLRKRAIIAAIAVGGVILLVLVLSLLFTVFVGRSMVRPLRRLRAGALEVAGIRLPETVRRMSETDGENVPVEVEPIDVESSDEIGEVARAFDQVHREALRLAATEAALRGNVNAMFVNLSRRSQSLVERQIRLIDELEQGEQDSERLSSLFQMDHLATRMRRNSENLLVLAGHESSRRWNQPVPLVDVLRAAISEIEQYERVMLNVQPGIAVRGPAVNDVVHLIAELAENATSFSSADTPVSVSGHLLGSGGVLLDITDEGVGMGGDEMAHANWRLDNPPVVDVAVSRRMGLFVVARLAARHGIRVRLRSANGNGLTALVWLPDEVIVHEGASVSADPGRLPERPARVAIEPPPVSGSSGEWTAPGVPSAYDEVAAARARFTPLPQESNGDYGNGGYGGYGNAGEGGQPGFGGREREYGGGFGGQSGSGQFATPPAGERPFGDRSLGGAGFGDYLTGERDLTSAEFTGRESGSYDRQGTGSGPPDLGPPRVPGVGPHPGRVTTGPIPAIDTGSRSAAEHPEWFAAAGPRAGAGQPTSWLGEPSPPDRPAWRSELTDQRSAPVFGAPVARTASSSGTFRTQDPQFGVAAGGGGVIVPPPASLGEENRLPIFEAVESDWFRRGRPTVEWPTGQTGKEERVANRGWASPADDGWRAAEIAVAPASGGMTVAGLPRRVPQANLIPGTAADAAPAPVPVRSAAATRERFASLQRGIREGRAASGIDRSAGPGEVPGDG